jgi:hypothetical protein
MSHGLGLLRSVFCQQPHAALQLIDMCGHLLNNGLNQLVSVTVFAVWPPHVPV